jgi:hypothetical protein
MADMFYIAAISNTALKLTHKAKEPSVVYIASSLIHTVSYGTCGKFFADDRITGKLDLALLPLFIPSQPHLSRAM